MKKILNEWRRFVTEVSKQEASYFGPAFTELEKNPQLAWNMNWRDNNIGKLLGTGYSRAAYEIAHAPELVWKVAHAYELKAGSFTNNEERKYFNKYPEFFPRVYLTGKANFPEEEDKDWLTDELEGTKGFVPWIVVEKVKVFDTAEEYEKVISNVFPVFDRITEKLKAFGFNPKEIMLGPLHRPVGDLGKQALFTKLIRDGNLEQIQKTFETIARNNYVTGLSLKDYMNEMTSLIVNSGPFTRLIELLQWTGADAGDIRVGNVATTKDYDKFIIIDISKFLRDTYSVTPKAISPATPPPSPATPTPSPEDSDERRARVRDEILSDLFKKIPK